MKRKTGTESGSWNGKLKAETGNGRQNINSQAAYRARVPYSRKYWDLNLAVWYGIAIRTCTQEKNLADFNLAVGIPPNLIPRQIFRLCGYTVAYTRNTRVCT